MSSPPASPRARGRNHSSSSYSSTSPSPSDTKRGGGQGGRKGDFRKPNESWFLILVNAFKSNFEQTLTYKETELYNWIMQAYPYYRHDMHTMHTSVKTTLSTYECFRQNGRSTWTFIPRRALVHLETLNLAGKDLSEDDDDDDDVDDDDEEDKEEEEEDYDAEMDPRMMDYDNHHYNQYQGSGDMRMVDHVSTVMDNEDLPTLTPEEIERFKQEQSGANQAKRLKRKASSGHASVPRTRSPPAGGLQDECNMSMEAWCNLLVQMFEASPKQKTIREIYAWVHDNYPIYQNAPGDAWQADMTAALESNPLFKAMGRGRWQMATILQQQQHTNAPKHNSQLYHQHQQQPPQQQQQQQLQPYQQQTIIVQSVGQIVPAVVAGPAIPVEAQGNESDSPSVTEDEDWKAIGSKRLLNFSFRRYSIATDTFPKNHYKNGTTTATAGPSAVSSPSVSIIGNTASSRMTSNHTTPQTPIRNLAIQSARHHDTLPANYSAGRRFSSYHQPTPKNSPPLSATTHNLSTVNEFSAQLTNALSEETDDDEDMTKRYMAPLHNAINSAIQANQYPNHPSRSRQTSPRLATSTIPAITPSISVSDPSQHHHQSPQLQHSDHHAQHHSPLSNPGGHGPSSLSPPPPSSQPIASEGIAVLREYDNVPLSGMVTHLQTATSSSPLFNSSAYEKSSVSALSVAAQESQSLAITPRQQEGEMRIPGGETLATDQMTALEALALLSGYSL